MKPLSENLSASRRRARKVEDNFACGENRSEGAAGRTAENGPRHRHRDASTGSTATSSAPATGRPQTSRFKTRLRPIATAERRALTGKHDSPGPSDRKSRPKTMSCDAQRSISLMQSRPSNRPSSRCSTRFRRGSSRGDPDGAGPIMQVLLSRRPCRGLAGTPRC